VKRLARSTLPTAEADALLRQLPPIDVDQWQYDMAEIDELLADTAIEQVN
jgi:hypothetical protein